MNTEQTKVQPEMLSAMMDGQLHGAAFAEVAQGLAHDPAAHADWHCYHLVGDVLRSPELADCAGDAAFLSRFQARLAREPRFDRPALLPQVESEFASELVAASALPPGVASISDAMRKSAVNIDKAANESSFRWKLVAGFASLAAVSAIGWNLLAVSAPGLGGAQLAQVNGGFSQSASPVILASAALPAERAERANGPALIATTVGAPDTTANQSYAAAQTVTLPGGEAQVMIRNPRLDALMAAHKQFGGASALQTPAPFLREATFEAPEQ